MMPGIPKFREESHPERAKGQWMPILSELRDYSYSLSVVFAVMENGLECKIWKGLGGL
jgi:hypothetical protein